MEETDGDDIYNAFEQHTQARKCDNLCDGRRRMDVSISTLANQHRPSRVADCHRPHLGRHELSYSSNFIRQRIQPNNFVIRYKSTYVVAYFTVC